MQYRYQQGKVQVCTNRFLGYDKDKDGNLVINQEEAAVVKRIYREYLEGRSYYDIGKGLMADGIKTAAGKDVWLASTVKKILQNEKYMGDALLQKTVTTDFLTKKRVANKGIVPQYYVENSHEAIIPREIYMKVQEEIVRRAHLQTGTGKRRVYSGKYALSSIVFCGHCGDVFQRTHWNLPRGKTVVWRCVSRLHKKTSGIDCPARTVTEDDLHKVIVTAVNQALDGSDTFLPALKAGIKKALSSPNSQLVAEVDTKLEEMQKELLKKANAKQAFDSIAGQIEELREEKQRLLLEDATNAGVMQKVQELEAFIDGQSGPVTGYDEMLVRRLIEKVTVYDDHFTVEFKSGLETDVTM